MSERGNICRFGEHSAAIDAASARLMSRLGAGCRNIPSYRRGHVLITALPGHAAAVRFKNDPLLYAI